MGLAVCLVPVRTLPVDVGPHRNSFRKICLLEQGLLWRIEVKPCMLKESLTRPIVFFKVFLCYEINVKRF